MSSAAAAEAPAPAPKGKKKLIIIIAVAALVLVGGGAAAFMLLGKKSHGDEDGDEVEKPKAAHAAVKFDPKAVPTYVPLDPFTVNLADRDAERFAQVGLSLEVGDPHLGDQIKAYMPVIRSQILLAIADRTANELLNREGKAKLARKIAKETSRVLGVDVEDDQEEPEEDADSAAKKPSKQKKKKRSAPQQLPIRAVHFSTFIVQ